MINKLAIKQLQHHSSSFFSIVMLGLVVLTPSLSYAIEEKINYSMYLNISKGLVDDDVIALDKFRQQLYAVIEPILKKRNKKIRFRYANEELNLPTVSANAIPVNSVKLAQWLKTEDIQSYLEKEKIDYLLLGRFDFDGSAHKLRFQVVDTENISQIESADNNLFKSMGRITLDNYLANTNQLDEVRLIVKNIVQYLNNNIVSLKQRRVVQCGCFLFDRGLTPAPGMASIGTSLTDMFVKKLKTKYKKNESITIMAPKRQYKREIDCNKRITFDALYADLVITGAIIPKSGNTNINVDMDIINPRNDFESVDIYSKQERTDETGRLANHLAKHARKVMEEFF